MEFKDVAEYTGYAVLFILIICGIALLLTIPTYFLWNWLMPKIFGLPKITLLETLGLLLLSSFLIRSSGASSKK